MAKRQLTPVAAGDQEEVFGELRQPVDLLRRSADGLAELLGGAGMPEREPGLGSQPGQRRP